MVKALGKIGFEVVRQRGSNLILVRRNLRAESLSQDMMRSVSDC